MRIEVCDRQAGAAARFEHECRPKPGHGRWETAMHYRTTTILTENEIRARSYLIWERECRPEGKSEEHWWRAKAELEAEFEQKCATALDGKSSFVIPLLLVSSPPARRISAGKAFERGSALSRAA
jgi:hypothetical protein